jgi:exosortase
LVKPVALRASVRDLQPPAVRQLAVWALLLVGFGWLYWDVVRSLVHDWSTDDNYSHGFLVVPIAIYLAWERRARLRALAVRPSHVGLLVVLLSLAVLCAGKLGAELFLARTSMIGVGAGTILFLYGRQHLRALAFPLAFLLLMVPLPFIVFNEIAFPLQLLASRFGEAALALFGIPVLREGNVIVLAHATLEVAEACSGIRSLVSLLALSIVFGYFSDPRNGVRTGIAIAAIPIAVLANGARVAGTGLAAHYYGAEAAEGFFHAFSGWAVFGAAMAMLFAVQRAIQWCAPARVARPVRVSQAGTGLAAVDEQC